MGFFLFVYVCIEICCKDNNDSNYNKNEIIKRKKKNIIFLRSFINLINYYYKRQYGSYNASLTGLGESR